MADKIKPDRSQRTHGADDYRGFERLSQPQAHEYIAEQLRRHIGLKLVLQGEALPTERELARTFGAGRATVQRAMRILAADGLIETRRGRGGGTFVRVGRDEVGEEHLLMELWNARHEVEDALEFRHVMEPAAAAYAAGRRTNDDISGMRIASEAMRTAPSEQEFMRYDTEVHLRIARASRNDQIYTSLEQVRLVLNQALAALPESEVWHERMYTEHELIIAAIEREESDTAHAIMLAHVRSAERALQAVLAQLARHHSMPSAVLPTRIEQQGARYG